MRSDRKAVLGICQAFILYWQSTGLQDRSIESRFYGIDLALLETLLSFTGYNLLCMLFIRTTANHDKDQNQTSHHASTPPLNI
jgi:hypothetical protein